VTLPLVQGTIEHLCVCPMALVGYRVFLIVRSLSICPKLCVLISLGLEVANTKWARKDWGDTQE